MTELNAVIECSPDHRKKRSDFYARERSVFEIIQADLSSCDLSSIHVYMYARSIEKTKKTKTKTRDARIRE